MSPPTSTTASAAAPADLLAAGLQQASAELEEHKRLLAMKDTLLVKYTDKIKDLSANNKSLIALANAQSEQLESQDQELADRDVELGVRANEINSIMEDLVAHKGMHEREVEVRKQELEVENGELRKALVRNGEALEVYIRRNGELADALGEKELKEAKSDKKVDGKGEKSKDTKEIERFESENRNHLTVNRQLLSTFHLQADAHNAKLKNLESKLTATNSAHAAKIDSLHRQFGEAFISSTFNAVRVGELEEQLTTTTDCANAEIKDLEEQLAAVQLSNEAHATKVAELEAKLLVVTSSGAAKFFQTQMERMSTLHDEAMREVQKKTQEMRQLMEVLTLAEREAERVREENKELRAGSEDHERRLRDLEGGRVYWPQMPQMANANGNGSGIAEVVEDNTLVEE